MMGTNRLPLNAQIEVTEDCNHFCFYCYNSGRVHSQNKKMGKETARKISRILIEDIQPFRTTITGGEPFLNLPSSVELAKYLGRAGKSVSINTNFALANESGINALRRAHTKISFLVSIPSLDDNIFEQITGRRSLSRVLRNLGYLKNEGIRATVNMVLHRLNYREVYNQGIFLRNSYGICNFAATPAIRPSFDKGSDLYLDSAEVIESFRGLVRLRREGLNVSVLEAIPFCMLPEDLRKLSFLRRGCSAGRSGIQIGCNGKVRTCSHSPFTEGNVLEEPFSEIWERMRHYRENEYIPKECRGCLELKFCNGGCRYEGLEGLEQLSHPDSRMKGMLGYSCEPVIELNAEMTYKVASYRLRKENDGSYTLFNGQSTYNADPSVKTFIDKISLVGFRLNSFPEELRLIAGKIGRQLKRKGFLK